MLKNKPGLTNILEETAVSGPRTNRALWGGRAQRLIEGLRLHQITQPSLRETCTAQCITSREEGVGMAIGIFVRAHGAGLK